MKQQKHDCPGGDGIGVNDFVNPFSLELGPDEDKRDILEFTTGFPNPGKMRILLGDDVPEDMRQSARGSLQAVSRLMMAEYMRKGSLPGNLAGYGNWASASAADITIDADSASGELTDVFILVDAAFPASSHKFMETFNQLLAGLLERSADH